ncbi:MAG: carboxypeptidase-like regulatory domain-containing protein [Gammaproteobacteria bacterium]|jgi:hypothetical protein|nr:carboxypeptidase-like regulatory domain-containing protein [Gammaproteobacteria bacterium]
MIQKRVFHYCLLLLSLCLVTASAGAADSTLLIDNTRGIDNTRTPSSQQLKEINESLSDILSEIDAIPEDSSEAENIGTENSGVLIDNRLGIDNIDEPISPEEEKLTTSPPDIRAEKTTPQVEAVDSATANPESTAIDEPVSEPALEQTPTEIAEPLLPVETDTVDAAATTAPAPQQEAAMPQKQPADTVWIPQDSDLRILEIRVESYVFEDVIGAYQHKDIILVPLGDLSSILDIAITVTPNFASGFIINEDNTFSVDTKRHEVILKGVAGSYNSELVKSLDGDLYVESNLLGKWLNMKLDIDLYASRLWVKSDLKLPFLARIEREKRISQALSRLNQTEQQYPQQHDAYRNYSVPFVDQTLRLGQRFSDAGNSTSFNSITYATADLMQHESAWFLAANDQDGIDDFRVTFGRTDDGGDLLGPLHARQYQFGHVVEPRVGLINLPGELEPGITVSNYPVGMQTEYDRHRFIGELLPGWEDELYRNNALIGYQKTAINGQYDFQNVPLLFGNNHFRLVFYGPKGEIQEETKLFQLSQALTKQGRHYYRASTTTDDLGEQRTTAQYDYGLSRNLSSTFNIVSIPLQEATEVVQHNYLRAKLTGYWDALLASASVISDTESGNALEIDLQTRIDNPIIGFHDVYLSNFFSEEYRPSSTEISRSSLLRIDTAIPSSFLPRIPVAFGFRRDEYATGGELFEITNQISMSTHGVAATNLLTNQQVTGQPATTNGNFQLSTNINQVRLRNTLSYSLKPETELTNVTLTLDPGPYEDYRFSFGINHSLQQDVTEYSALASRLSGKYSLSFGARYNSNNEINLDVSFSVGFGYEPRRERWEQDSHSLANHGSVSARFFIDSNQDGIFNGDDVPIEDIGVRINGGYHNGSSDHDGILFITGIPAHNPTNVTIAPESLDDPLWIAAVDGVQVVPRPGHAIQIDFPIFTSGEIDGTVNLNQNGRQFGVGRVSVELIDLNDRVIATTETAYDGFYILSKLPLGDYRVRISQQQLNKLGLRTIAEEPITLKADEPFINGIDFNLEAVEPD